ncbi:hypothetical protein TRVL_09189 [Trypanosoma vivax]|nr:hypothetical protein TRVL_09189 [Trypanosoma vivax]
MEGSTIQEIHDLKLQQEWLERELAVLEGTSAQRHGDTLVDVNELQSSITAAAAPTMGERLKLLEEMRRRHKKEASRALQRYFAAVSDYPNYQARREHQLRSAQPFSFVSRELKRPQRIRTRRMLEDLRQREMEEERELNHTFRSTPVPPSTYMNKYDLMLEEWRQRRATVEALAVSKAECLKKEKEMMTLSRDTMRDIREVMGVRREHKARDDSDADADVKDRRGIVEINQAPLEVKIKLWPAIEEHEQIRRERIKQRAAQAMTDIKTEELKRAAALERERQLTPQFGVTYTELQNLQNQRMRVEVGNQMQSNIVPVSGPVVEVAAQPGVPVAGSSATGFVSPAPTSVPIPVPGVGLVVEPLGKLKVTDIPVVEHVTRSDHLRGNANASKVAPRGRQFTFKPKIRDGVPNFEMLWEKDRLMMDERKSRQKPTQVRPFSLSKSRENSVARGRSLQPSQQKIKGRSISRSVRRVRSSVRPRCSAPGKRNTPENAEDGVVEKSVLKDEEKDEGKVNQEKKEQETEEKDKKMEKIPRGTITHAVRTQHVYSKHVSAEQSNPSADHKADEVAALQEACRKQRIVNARLREYLRSSRCDTDAVIRKKVRALRAEGRRMEREAAERLEEMRVRVAQIPPIFVEPKHLQDIAKMRAETKEEIVQMLKDSGVDRRTLSAIMRDEIPVGAAGASANNEAEDVGSSRSSTPSERHSGTVKDKSSGKDDGSSSRSSGGSDTHASVSKGEEVGDKRKDDDIYSSDSFENVSDANEGKENKATDEPHNLEGEKEDDYASDFDRSSSFSS